VKTLVVVPCGAAKIWKRNAGAGPTQAKHAYAGTPFKINREYAQSFADRWVILSAKYGFIDPEFVIPGDYNVTFNDPATGAISVTELRSQVQALGLGGFDRVVALGSRKYASNVEQAFEGFGPRVSSPVAGLGMFKAPAAVRRAIYKRTPF
jgi:hypothetical protein